MRIRALVVTVAGVLGVLLVVGAMLLGLAGAGVAAPAADPTPPGSAPASGQVTSAAPSSAAEPEEGITGTIRGPDGPLPGVKITVFQDGAEIGSATTDDKGKWLVPVPKPGTYQVTLDVKTLPQGVQLRNQGGETLPALNVQPGSIKAAIFPVVAEGQGSGSQGGAGNSQLDYYVSVAVVGLEFGLIIAMTAVGLSLIFGTTRLINFAHGELVTIGAVVAYIFGTSPLHWPFILAIVLAIVGVGLLGGLIERGLWRPLRKRGTGLIQMFIISIGLSLLLRHGILFFFGSQRQQYVQATTQAPLQLGPISLAPRDLVIIVISILVLVGMAMMLQHTRIGKAMRALADNRDLAEASGIDVDRVILNVWVLGGGLAALGGVFYGLTAAVYWDMGFNLLLLMFAGVILGGLGSAYGAMLGSIVVGLVAQFSTVWFPAELENAWALLVLIVVLLVRPQGLLGRLQRAG
ncbi:MAG TPA: branched-chain amino acid ABC transporter permease [Nakamurella sp.]|nr:branched-chain amino acid ABC transporter permease [Nakamurella sp.]